jgi:hypothetical protein
MTSQSSTLSFQHSIELHIERLVFDGVDIEGGRAVQLQAVVEDELTRLFTEKGLPSFPAGAVPSLTARDISLGQTVYPAHTGRRIAHAIFGSLDSRAEQSDTRGSPR